MTQSERADVVVVGSGPTGAAYARTLRRLCPEMRIVMLESGPVLSGRAGTHVFNIPAGEARESAQIASQGPRHAAYLPVERGEWSRRVAGDRDASLLRRPGLFVANNTDDQTRPEAFAGFAAANVGGMGAHWTGGCPRPARCEYPYLFADSAMNELLTASERLMVVDSNLFRSDPVLESLINVLGRKFATGRAPDRAVQLMPLAADRVGGETRPHGTDVILGEMLTGDKGFALRPESTAVRIIIKNGQAAGVEVHDRRADRRYQIDCSAVVVAADSLHGPQLLHASGIGLPALGRYLNEHFQVVLPVELQGHAAPWGMLWIPYLGEDFPFSVTIGPASAEQLPFDRPNDRALAFVGVFCASDVIPGNRLWFDDNKLDWRGMPQLSIEFGLTEKDQRTRAAARALALEIANAVGRPLRDQHPISPPMGSSLHYQGTMRMGSDADTAVCDRSSEVWGVRNLHVAGNGVIPTSTGTNPTLMSVSLAIAGAQALASKF